MRKNDLRELSNYSDKQQEFEKEIFFKRMENKGWTKETLAKRWGVKERQIYNIGSNLKNKDLDALNGLPDMSINLMEYDKIMRFMLKGEWTMENLIIVFNQYDISDISKMFDLLGMICFAMIMQSSKSYELFKSYQRAMGNTHHSFDARLLGISYFISEQFFSVFPEHYLDLIKTKEKE